MPADFEKVKTIDLKISKVDGMRMVYVPAGEFIMGSNLSNTKLQRKIFLDAYWIDQTPVTMAMYAHFLDEMYDQYTLEMESDIFWFMGKRILGKKGEIEVVDGYEDHPVMGVSWYGAQAYCNWARRNLPSDAQWEKAARGTNGRTYPWGEDDPHPRFLNYQFGDKMGDSTIVGSYPDGASPYGALDMVGNVWEWVADCYDVNFYSSMPYRNPFNAEGNPEERILRGGSYSSGEDYLTTYSRLWMNAGSCSNLGPYSERSGYGFRCCLLG